MLARPRAVIFDMDGLMLDTEPLAARAWTDAARDLGLAFDHAVTTSLVGRTFTDCRALIVAQQGPDYPVDRLMAAWHDAYDAIVEREGIVLKAGLLELLDWLEREQVRKAVATSTRRERALAKLSSTALLPRFAALVGGDEIANGKPAPDIFLLAAERIGVPPHACLVLEDSPAGFEAAIRAEMAAIVVPDLCEPPGEVMGNVPLVLRTLHEVRAHLATLAS